MERVIPGKHIVATVDNIKLPEGISKDDLREAVGCAMQAVGISEGRISLFVRDRVLHEGREVGAKSYHLSDRHSVVEIGVEGAKTLSSPSYMTLPKYFVPGNPNQQLWAMAFEEAFHQSRIWTGEFDSSYKRLQCVRSEGDIRSYFQQPEKKAMADALNNGVLSKKFGPSFMYYEGRVVKISISNVDKPWLTDKIRAIR